MQFMLSKLSLMLVLFVLEEIFVYSEVMKVSYLYFIKTGLGVILFCFCVFVVAADLIFTTRDWKLGPPQWKQESLTAGPLGISKKLLFLF